MPCSIRAFDTTEVPNVPDVLQVPEVLSVQHLGAFAPLALQAL